MGTFSFFVVMPIKYFFQHILQFTQIMPISLLIVLMSRVELVFIHRTKPVQIMMISDISHSNLQRIVVTKSIFTWFTIIVTGTANRKSANFKMDPNLNPTYSSMNSDYKRSGWSRGHMAPAADNKFSQVRTSLNCIEPN